MADSTVEDVPLVTIVTPSYNQGRFIRATIESVLSQNYPNIEYIVMDAGSTDETSSIVREYSSRLEFISEPDRGQSHAINKGFQRAKGSALAWLNSDDVFLPGAVNSAMQALSRNRGAGLVYGDGYCIDAAGTVTSRFPHTREPDLWRLVHLSDYILQQAVFFSRQALDDVGYLDESLHYGLDWDLLIRIGLKYPLIYLPESLASIREYPETKSSSGGKVRARELHAMLRKHTGMFLPPGSIVYGLDTYSGLVCEAIRKYTPGVIRPVGSLLENAVRFVAGNVVSYTLFHSQGLYGDGWAGKTLLYMLRSGVESVRIAGMVPETVRQLRGQVLDVECNGLQVRSFAVEGEFSVGFDVPRSLSGQALHLRILARRSCMPSLLPWKGDHRRLAYRLESIREE
jgi:glycosyltransferase involved in cell wall biosynthesis